MTAPLQNSNRQHLMTRNGNFDKCISQANSQAKRIECLAWSYITEWPCTVKIAWVDMGRPYPGSYEQEILANRGQKSAL